jgi:Acetyltransferases
MIVLTETQEEQERLINICTKSAFGCKIMAIIKAYGFDKSFCCFWVDTDKELAFAKLDSLMIIAGTIENSLEVREFLKAVGVEEIMCAVRNSELLGINISEHGEICKKKSSADMVEIVSDREINIRRIYELLKKVDMRAEEFESFYLDLSHRLRHGTAQVLTDFSEDGSLSALLIISAILDDSAIISAIAVDKNYRRMGKGRSLMLQAERVLSDKTIYIFKEEKKNNEFYSSLGYKHADSWVVGRLNEF